MEGILGMQVITKIKLIAAIVCLYGFGVAGNTTVQPVEKDDNCSNQAVGDIITSESDITKELIFNQQTKRYQNLRFGDSPSAASDLAQLIVDAGANTLKDGEIRTYSLFGNVIYPNDVMGVTITIFKVPDTKTPIREYSFACDTYDGSWEESGQTCK